MKRKYFLTGFALVLVIAGTFLFFVDRRFRIVGQVRKSKQNIEIVAKAVNSFYDCCGRFPSEQEGLEVLVAAQMDCKTWDGPLLLEIPKDGWDQKLIYSYKGFGNLFDIRSLGADGKMGGAGADRDITYEEVH